MLDHEARGRRTGAYQQHGDFVHRGDGPCLAQHDRPITHVGRVAGARQRVACLGYVALLDLHVLGAQSRELVR